ncbi:hypothetical protein KKA13_03430 [Patescibacteria group bacterium]|nr:hypothetical protein [Patescibacteria group bacterium]
MPAEHPPIPESEKEVSLEQWLATDFKQQYNKQVEIFSRIVKLANGKETSILQTLECGEVGIMGIDGYEYPLPKTDDEREKLRQGMEKAGMTEEEIKEEVKNITTIEDIIRENKESYETKLKQGFTRLQMTPFGMPLETMALILERTIVKHHKEGRLFATKDNPTDPNEPLNLDTNQPLFKWDGWIDPNAPEGARGADVTGKCVYHPKQLTKDGHGGQTKQQILDEQREKENPFVGWEVKLLEANINIPRENKGQAKHNRKQLETNRSSNDYLKTLLTNPQYAKEQGMTLEDWITLALTYLEEQNQVIDDFNGNGSACLLTGSYNFDHDCVAGTDWSRVGRRAGLSGDGPGVRRTNGGFRPAVEIKRP